jgi:hypothetical protein
VRWVSTYQAVNGTAVAQGITVTTASIFTSFPHFTTLVSNLWSEYRVTKIQVRFRYTFNTAQSGLYIPATYTVQFRGDTPPAATIAGISAIPWFKTDSPPRGHMVTWTAPRDDPEAWIFRQTSAALPIAGGVVAYVGAAAPTATVAYLVTDVYAYIDVRSRKV